MRIDVGSSDDVRIIQRRRNLHEIAFRLTLEAAGRGLAWTARDEQEVVGIAVAHDSEHERYVGDLFVEPSYRGQGVGAALLQMALSGTDELSHAMLVDPSDAAALALSLRFGMAPREVLLRLAGAIPREEELAKMAAGAYRFGVEPIDAEAHAYALNELDRHACGTTRPADHAEFAASSCGNTFSLNGECVGYAYVWPDGRIGPLACASEAYLVQIFAYALVTLERSYGASWCTALVPGSNRRIARTALRAGLRIEESLFLASETTGRELSAYSAFHKLLL